MTEEIQDPKRAELDELHRLRGRFLSEMADVEERLNWIICMFFGVPAERRQVFTAWVLVPVSLDDKINIVSKATRSTEPGSTMSTVVTKLRLLKNARNDIAHGAISLDMRTYQPIRDLPWAAMKWTRGGIRWQVLTVEGLNLLVETAKAMAALLIGVLNEVAKATDGLVALDTDWVTTYEQMAQEHDIPEVSDELGRYIHASTSLVGPEPDGNEAEEYEGDGYQSEY